MLALCLSHYTDLDVKIQNHLFDFETKKWLVDRDEPVKKFIFYRFPKILFGGVIIACLSGAILGFRRKDFCRHFFIKNRHKLLLIFFGLAFIPLIVGNIKKFTNIYCPTQLEIYGEKYPYVRIFDHYPADFQQPKKAKCFPAGHSVTGFSLFILFFALSRKRLKIYGLLGGFVLGWILGFYQMAKGAHFFGDTLVSMLLCFLVAAMIARFYFKKISYDQQ